MNISLNASDYIYSTTAGVLPDVSVYVRQLGVAEALFFAFCLFVTAVVFHELGHWFYMLKSNPKSQIHVLRVGKGIQLQTGTEEQYTAFTKDELITLYLSGVVTGLIPIFIAWLIHPIYLLVLPAYIVGSYSDLKKVFDLMRIQ